MYRMSTMEQELLMVYLLEFYKNKNNLNKLRNIIEKKSKISLRILDWFVTNYCKKNKIVYQYIDDNGNKRESNVHNDYEAQLKTFSKRYFDPFRRIKNTNDLIILYDQDKNKIETTVSQLNFFKWIIEKKIIEYVEINFNDLINCMNYYNKITSIKNKIKDKEDAKKLYNLKITNKPSGGKKIDLIVEFN